MEELEKELDDIINSFLFEFNNVENRLRIEQAMNQVLDKYLNNVYSKCSSELDSPQIRIDFLNNDDAIINDFTKYIKNK